MPISIPNKISVPWATSGLKNTIPAASDPLTGLAGYDQGFTAINMTPKTAGGIPPFGQDFNGIFYAVTEALRYLETGALFPYDGTFATAVGGYPLGALVQRTDGYGLWRNISPNNTSDPEAFGAGWAPEGSGITSVAMSNVNVTLTALQAARSIVVITGTLTANLNLVFPTYPRQWLIVNNATGAFSVTAKTAAGSGVTIATGAFSSVYGDGTDIKNVASNVTFSNTAENQAGTVSTKVVSPLGIREAFNAAGTAPVYACRAWVNFDGTGVISIRSGGNVSSISDLGVGQYRANFTTAMPDATFAMAGVARDGVTRQLIVSNFNANNTASAAHVTTAQDNGTLTDGDVITVAIYR